MTASVKTFRYQLPRKATKANCPSCGPRHRKTLSRYVDTQTGEPLPEAYGRCDRESNCGYHLSPYHKGASGQSYADEVRAQSQQPDIPKEWFSLAGKWKRKGVARPAVISGLCEPPINATRQEAERVAAFLFDKPEIAPNTAPEAVVHHLPDEVLTASLGHYEDNQFARLLTARFGPEVTTQLLHRFQIGTSSYWPGACVFWLVDEQGRARAGQVVLFADDWHKAKYTDREGNVKACISSVSHGLLRRYKKLEQPAPDWLIDYHDRASRWPILFGINQLAHAPLDKPIAIVEAPKTAVVCSALIPAYIWLAVGAKSYLNAERLASLRGRRLMLYPDLNAYHDVVGKNDKVIRGWLSKANELRAAGFDIAVSDHLEQIATDEQRTAGLDLADFLLAPPVEPLEPLVVRTSAEWTANPGSILQPDESQIERLPDPIQYDFPPAPLAFDAEQKLRWVLWMVLPPGVDEGSVNDCAMQPIESVLANTNCPFTPNSHTAIQPVA